MTQEVCTTDDDLENRSAAVTLPLQPDGDWQAGSPSRSLHGEGLSSLYNLVACPDCDLLQRIPKLPPGRAARCPRCGHRIDAGKPDYPDRVLALTVAAAIVLVIANTTPLMRLSAMGRQSSTTIFGGVLGMWLQGQEITAALMAFCTVVAPVAYIGFMLTVLLTVRRSLAPPWVGILLRLSKFNQAWAMVEIMMLGILVALIKIASLATVIPGIGMGAAGLLIVLIASISISFDPRVVWTRIRWVDEQVMESAAFQKSVASRRTGS